MSERETEGVKEFNGEIGGVDNRLADSAVQPDKFQLIEGIMPWQGQHRRLFGKKVQGKLHGVTSDNLAVITINAIPGNHIIYQTREGLMMDQQYDPDALRWWTAAGNPSFATLQKVSNLSLALKAANLWSKFDILYPFAGGTALAHSKNLISANYTITWNGGMSHTANGITGNAAAYGNTNYSPFTAGLTIGNSHIAQYVRVSVGAPSAIGVYAATGYRFAMHAPWADGNLYADMNDATAGFGRASGPGTTQLLAGSRTSLTDLRAYKQGVQIGNSTGLILNVMPPGDMYVMAVHDVASVGFPGSENVALYSVGRGLSPTEMAAYAAIVQTYQTAMGRQV